jgi:RHS repeat-associated protein
VAPDSAASSGETTSHFHPDHLGSPRQVTGPGGAQLAQHSYYPFGSEATAPAQDDFQLKFTGHERDENGGGKGMLDYMHARHCSPVLGRFVSIDPKVLRVPTKIPQRWNRYSYSNSNPIRFLDRNGRETIIFIVAARMDAVDTSFWHAAILATSGKSRASRSEGTPLQLQPSVSRFINDYLDQGRRVTAFLLNPDAGRDSQMVNALKTPRKFSFDQRRQNCATECGDTLRSTGVLQDDQRPERGILYDSPQKLQAALEDGILSPVVEATVIFDPQWVQEVTPGQVQQFLQIPDEGRVDRP